MKILYLDCSMGAAGDMLAAALLELLPDKEAFITQMNSLGIPGVQITAEKSTKCGICGTHLRVNIHGQEESDHHTHSHGTMADIRQIVSTLPVPTMVKLDILAVYNEIAEAESQVHGVPVSQIHFHEVGSLDAVADITAVCLLMHQLAADKVVASPVHVGSGTVRCAHGILPVPAPATARLLRGIPVYGGSIQAELCTPTGAALLKHFVAEFGPMPAMAVSAVGYGMGKKDFPQANCVRAMLAETQDEQDAVVELSCNIDDMTGEMLGYALDAFTVPIGMKKSRPGILLTLLCRQADAEKFVRLMFQHTTTLGVRQKLCSRYTLSRSIQWVDTPYGKLRRKDSAGYGISRSKYEYEDLTKAARERGCSIADIMEKLP